MSLAAPLIVLHIKVLVYKVRNHQEEFHILTSQLSAEVVNVRLVPTSRPSAPVPVSGSVSLLYSVINVNMYQT